jgi:hypothetical protein
MVRSTTILAILLLLVASPTLAQTATEASEGFSVGWAKPTMHGVSIVGMPMHDASFRPRLVLNRPVAPPVPLTHMDFGAYEPYAPSLARRVLPNTPNDTDPFQLTLNGTKATTSVGTKVQAQVDRNVVVRAKATTVVPTTAGAKWRPTPDLKVDVRYRF